MVGLNIHSRRLNLVGVLLGFGVIAAETQEIETIDTRGAALVCEQTRTEIPEMPLLGDDDKLLVVDALQLSQESVYPICAYSIRSVINDEPSKVERFTPTNDDAGDWSVVSVGDEPPSIEFLEDYEHQGEQVYPPLNYEPFVDFNTLKQESRSDNMVNFVSLANEGMVADDERMHGIVELTDVKLSIDANSRELKTFEVKLRESYKPNVFIRINKFIQQHDLEFDETVGDRILKEFKMSMDGRLMALKRLRVELEVELFDFHCPIEIQPIEVLCKYQQLENETQAENGVLPEIDSAGQENGFPDIEEL